MKDVTQLLTGTLCMGLIMAAGLAYLLPDSEREAFAGALATVGFQMEIPEDVEIIQTRAKGSRLGEAHIRSGSTQVRIHVIEGLDEAAAVDLAADIRLQLENLFVDRQAPYPGQLSTTLACPPEVLPIEVTDRGNALLLMTLFANDRLGFGGCSPDLLTQAATVALVHDPVEQRMLRVEVFEPVAEASGRGLSLIAGIHP
jgi:hypothetical protein